ncbi:MAG: hypothetical protein N3A69_17545, partial [Leptospiraceae bacterium]|nr:hypothetical protein [Leptospiraceae bacterium]
MYKRQGLHYERLGYKNKTQYLNSMKSFLQANSVLSANEKDLQILSEINIARAKTKLLPNSEEPLQYFYDLLKKVKEGDIQEARILFHALLFCYSENSSSSCNNLYNKFLKNQHVTSERKNLVDIFRNLNMGNLSNISVQEIKIDSELDEFILNLEIALLFEKNLEFDLALGYLKKSKTLAQGKEEEQVLNHFKTEIEFEKFFVEGIDTGALLEQENLYSLGKSKEWKKYKVRLETELEHEREHFKRNYLERIYSAFEKIPTSSYFAPASLSPIFLKDGETSLKLISNKDRSFLFYLFLLSSFYNPKAEINPQINLLLDAEKRQGNKNRHLWMTLK